MTMSDKLQALRKLKKQGGCSQLATSVRLVRNPAFDEDDSAEQKKRLNWTAEKSAPPPLHILLVVDMDVGDEHFWSVTLPRKLAEHLSKVDFPAGTTYELILAGPNNIYIHYPFSKPDQSYVNTFTIRSRRESIQPIACHIADLDVLIDRIFAATQSIPALPRALYNMAGLIRPTQLSWLMMYMDKFVPTSGNVLVLHVINHYTDIGSSDIVAYRAFLKSLESRRPSLNLWNYYMFEGGAVVMSEQLKQLGIKKDAHSDWSIGLDHPMVTASFVQSITTGNRPVTEVKVGCKSTPCKNGCTCQASCRDENDYVCVPPVGRPLIGKNCEWEAVVKCRADRSILVTIPQEAVEQFAMGIDNVVVQGCNNAHSVECATSPSCGPVDAPTDGFYSLECYSNAFSLSNGQWTFGQTIVFDRKTVDEGMTHAIAKVECVMQTSPVQSVIRPQHRDPQVIRKNIYWQPEFGFYKTEWGAPMVLANEGNKMPNGAVGYIIGERIHVRIRTKLNGVPSEVLPDKYSMDIKYCTVTPGNGESGNAIQIIDHGSPVADLPFPVEVDHAPGVLGNGISASQEGVGFSFQVFTYRAGSTLQLTCMVSINSLLRQRRSALTVEELDESEIVVAELLLFEPQSLEKDDIQVLAIEQEPNVLHIGDLTKNNMSIKIDAIAISSTPVWLVALSVLLSVIVLGVALYCCTKCCKSKTFA